MIAIQLVYWRVARIYRKHVTWSLSIVVTSVRIRKTQLPLLLRVEPCLQNYRLATRIPNLLTIFYSWKFSDWALTHANLLNFSSFPVKEQTRHKNFQFQLNRMLVNADHPIWLYNIVIRYLLRYWMGALICRAGRSTVKSIHSFPVTNATKARIVIPNSFCPISRRKFYLTVLSAPLVEMSSFLFFFLCASKVRSRRQLSLSYKEPEPNWRTCSIRHLKHVSSIL
jgi:hypothetical protein